MKNIPALVIALFLSGTTVLYAQSSGAEDVRLFQSFFRDAPISPTPFGEASLTYFDLKSSGIVDVGIQGGLAVTPKIELSGGLYFRSIIPDGEREDESGILDIPVYGRYNFVANQQTDVSAGTYLTLPVGSKDMGQGNVNFGFFGAVRHSLSDSRFTLAGNLGLDFLKMYSYDIGLIGFCPGFYFGYCATPLYRLSRQASVRFGGSAIYTVSDHLNLLGEFRIESETKYTALSGGLDYKISDAGRIRGNLTLGLDDGAPDFGFTAGFLVSFQ